MSEMLQVSPLQNGFLAPLLSTELLVDMAYAMEQYHNFLADIALLKAGAEYKDLGLATRREMQAPQIVYMAADHSNLVMDRWRLHTDNPDYKPKPGAVALLKLSGIMRSDSAASTQGVDVLERDLRQAFATPEISAVILDINSGGGEAMAGFRLRSVIAEKNKPVMAYVHYAASAAYLAATAATEIIAAHRGARIGSIGALISIDKVALQEYTDNYLEIYAEQSTHKNADLRAAKGGDFSLVQKSVNRLAGDFIGIVKGARALTGDEQTITETLSGKVFNAGEAKQRGLTDLTGNFNAVWDRAKTWAQRKTF